jgi:hypothetical protein
MQKLREPSDEGPYRVEQAVWRWPSGKTQYCNASVIGRSEEQRIPEIEIEGDNASILGRASRYQFCIRCSTEMLLRYGSYLVPRLA